MHTMHVLLDKVVTVMKPITRRRQHTFAHGTLRYSLIRARYFHVDDILDTSFTHRLVSDGAY